jgi:type VI secretion system secreted protein VgrG
MSVLTVSLRLSMPGGIDGRVVWCHIEEAVSELTRARVEVACAEDADFGSTLAQDARLEITVHGSSTRQWTLRVGSVDFLGIQHGLPRYLVALHAPLWLLRHTRNTRKFRNQSAKEIVAKVLSEGGVPHRFRLLREPPVRKYCVQYRESNLDFVQRLLEFEGIYHSLEPDGTLLLADRSPDAEPVGGPRSQFELLESASALERAEVGVHELRKGARVAPGKMTLNDFNWKTPRVALLSSQSAEADGELEIYDYPSGYRKPSQGAELAQMRLEAARVPARFVAGSGNVLDFAPAHRFGMGSEAGGRFAGDYLLVRAEHRAFDQAFADTEAAAGQTAYENQFEAIPLAVPFRPAVRTARPRIEGCHTAMVRGPAGEEIHTDRYGRFRAQFHWDREAVSTDDDSRWLRMLQESATSMTLARVGWEVAVAYIDGDPDRPVGLARTINGVMTPTYAQPASKTAMTIKTPSSPATGGFNEIKLDDIAESQMFYVKAERDLIGQVRHDRTERIGNNETHTVGQNCTHFVERDQRLSIGANAETKIDDQMRVQVLLNRTKSVGGSETIGTGGGINVSTKGNETETVGSLRLTMAGGIKPPDRVERAKGLVPEAKAAATTVGSATLQGGVSGGTAAIQGMVPTPKGVASTMTGGLSEGVSVGKLVDSLLQGSISRYAISRMSRTVGGAYIQASADNIQTHVGSLYAETVGGVKLTYAVQGGIKQTVTGPLMTTVGGAIFRKSTGDMGAAAKNTRIQVGATAALRSDELIEIRGNEIQLEAKSSLQLKVGAVSITMDTGKIAMEGKLRFEADEKVRVTGKDDNITKA